MQVQSSGYLMYFDFERNKLLAVFVCFTVVFINKVCFANNTAIAGPPSFSGRLRGLVVACRTTDHHYPCSNLGVGISEGCFIFDFASLTLKVARPI